MSNPRMDTRSDIDALVAMRLMQHGSLANAQVTVAASGTERYDVRLRETAVAKRGRRMGVFPCNDRR